MSYINYNNTSPEVTSNEKPMNLLRRYIEIIVSPGKAFEKITEMPKLLAPLLFMVISSILPILVSYSTFSQIIKDSIILANQKEGIILSDVELTNKVALSIKYSLVSTPLLQILTWFIGAVILFGIIKLFNGHGTFKQYLSITSHAYVITFLYILLTTILSFFTHKLGLDLSLSKVLSLFIPGLSGFTNGILKGISFFRVWQYAVIGIGVAAASKLSKSRVYIIMISSFCLYLFYLGYGELLGQLFTQ